MPVETYLGRGLPGRLDCVVDANPPVSQVVWTKNERPLAADAAPPPSRRVHVDRRGSLVFRVVSAVDEGRYACAAYSPLGAGRSSTTVRVYVRGDDLPSTQSCISLSVSAAPFLGFIDQNNSQLPLIDSCIN